MIRRDKVERIASYAVIAAFLVLVVFMCMAEYFSIDLQNSALFGGIVTLVTREMAALVIGRGEGGTFEGETNFAANGNGESEKD